MRLIWGKPVTLKFICLVILSLLGCNTVFAEAPGGNGSIPAPAGLIQCPPGDPVAIAESGVATKLGGDFVGCFESEQTMVAPGAAKPHLVPIEHAFAIKLAGKNYTTTDLDSIFAHIKDQWKGFDPLSKRFKNDYTGFVNDLIKSNGSNPSVTLASIKPVLESIDRVSADYYVVTSIRTYRFEVDGAPKNLTKVNADALALRRSQLVRLTIQRTLREPGDVDRVTGAIADWARATAQR